MGGLFITFEGPDGSGKSTQISLLHRFFQNERLPVLLTREPGGSPQAERVRRLLLDPKSRGLNPVSELLLFQASRSQHVFDTVLPALKAGRCVLCDRFTDSTSAYQAWGRGMDPGLVDRLNRLASYGLKPDLTLLFDLPAEEGLRRAGKRAGARGRDRMELAGLAFQRRVRRGFLALAKAEPKRVRLIRVKGRGPEAVHADVLRRVGPLLKKLS